MAKYTMYFVRTMPGVRRDFPEWDFGLENFGYESCERVEPIPLKALDREGAKLEAFQLWHQWRLSPTDSEPEGYWIVLPDGEWFDLHIGDEAEGTFP
jgi:hypothetical protein